MMYISDVFLRTEICVLIVDGSAMRLPIGNVTRKNVSEPAETQRGRGLAVAERDGLEARAEVLGVERAAPDHDCEPGHGVPRKRGCPRVNVREAEVDRVNVGSA